MAEIFINPLGAELENSVFYLQNAVKKLKESDTAALSADVATLKEKLNYLLEEVIGIENSVEGLNNYDDTPIKTKIDTALAGIQTNVDEIQGIKDKTESITKNGNGTYIKTLIPHPDHTEFKIGSNADVILGKIHLTTTHYSENSNSLEMNNELEITNTDGSVVNGGIFVYSDNIITLDTGPRTSTTAHYIRIGKKFTVTSGLYRMNEISDVNGLSIVRETTGITSIF
jgi:hypothetical protein